LRMTKERGVQIKVLKTEEIDLGGGGVRGVGVDRDGKNPAVFLVTAVLLDARLVFASLILSLNSAKNTQLDALDSWSEFNRWVSTIRVPTKESTSLAHRRVSRKDTHGRANRALGISSIPAQSTSPPARSAK